MAQPFIRERVYKRTLPLAASFFGSEQESGRMCILRGFLEARVFVFSSTQRRHLHENGQDCRFAVEMTLRGTYDGVFYRRIVVGPTELGNPHQTRGFHIPTATTATAPVLVRKANPAEIAGPVRFLHRTENSISAACARPCASLCSGDS